MRVLLTSAGLEPDSIKDFFVELVGKDMSDTRLDVHCEEGDAVGKVKVPVKDNIRLTNERVLVMYSTSEMEIIG